jgi:DNA modification methylase
MREPDVILDYGNIRLYCGDCLEILPTLEAGSVDAVVTDPPYAMNKASWDKKLVDPSWFTESLKTVRNTGAAYVFGDPVTLSSFQVFHENAGIAWAGRCVWWYEDGPCSSVAWTRKHEDCLVWHGQEHEQRTPFEPSKSNDPRWGERKRISTVWRVSRLGGRKNERSGHPTQKPERLIQMLIDTCSAWGCTILDPFMGSGTTGVACVKTGRKFIGIELDRGYFDIAVKRIEKALQERNDIDAGRLLEHNAGRICWAPDDTPSGEKRKKT